MKIEIEQSLPGIEWLVMLDNHTVTFRSKNEAEAFAERLQMRLDAPHNLPSVKILTDDPPASG